MDLDVHLFADAASAQQAVDAFAAIRASGQGLQYGEAPPLGDHALALFGPAFNGQEYTVYVSSGPLLIRVLGISPSGIPLDNVLAVTQAVLAPQDNAPQPTSALFVPASAYLPSSPAVNYAESFTVLTEGTYPYNDVVAALSPTGLSQSQMDALGWQDGAYRVFSCVSPPPGRATQIDVVIHQFRDAPAARQALPYARGMYVPGEHEVWNCDNASQLVVCVMARALSGSPFSDVQFVLNQVKSAVP